MVDDGVGQKPHRHARPGQTDAVIDILAVHKQRLIKIADLFNDRPGQQHTAESDEADLPFLGKFGAILFVAAQVLDLAGGGVQFAARKPNLICRFHEEHLRAADRAFRRLGQQLFQKIRVDGCVVVQQQRIVAAIGQGTAHPDIVGRRKADVFLLRQEHGVRRQFALQLRHRVIGRSIVD